MKGICVVNCGALFHIVIEDLADMGKISRCAIRANPRQQLFGTAESYVGVHRSLVSYGGYIAACMDDLAHNGGAIHNLGVVLYVNRSRHSEDKLTQIGSTSNSFQPILKR